MAARWQTLCTARPSSGAERVDEGYRGDSPLYQLSEIAFISCQARYMLDDECGTCPHVRISSNHWLFWLSGQTKL